MPYKGELQRGVPFTIDFAAGATALETSTMTIIKVNQRGGMHASAITLPGGTSGTINEVLGQRIVRLIVQMNLYPGSRVNLRLLQVSSQFTDTLEADTELVYNAVP